MQEKWTVGYKHSWYRQSKTGDVLWELQELDNAYPDAFYNGSANEHLMEYAEQNVNFEFWYDYLYMFLAAGLEWAVLREIETASVES